MILLAGGTGTLGRETLRLLTDQGRKVRVLTRDRVRATDLESALTEIVVGDVRDPASLGRAVAGIRIVISAMSGYGPTSGSDPRSVDWEGNRNLIAAAEPSRVEQFVLVSMHGARPDHPMELARMKFAAEQELMRSRMAWTIIRPTLFMETWTAVIGGQLRRSGKAVIFGRGENPMNLVSARDVAHLVALAVDDQAFRRVAVDVGGPENLTLNQYVEVLETVADRKGGRVRVPRSIVRLIAILARPFNPAVARLAHDAIVMDTTDFSFEPSAARGRYPAIPSTTLAEVALRYQDPTPELRKT